MTDELLTADHAPLLRDVETLFILYASNPPSLCCFPSSLLSTCFFTVWLKPCHYGVKAMPETKFACDTGGAHPLKVSKVAVAALSLPSWFTVTISTGAIATTTTGTTTKTTTTQRQRQLPGGIRNMNVTWSGLAAHLPHKMAPESLEAIDSAQFGTPSAPEFERSNQTWSNMIKLYGNYIINSFRHFPASFACIGRLYDSAAQGFRTNLLDLRRLLLSKERSPLSKSNGHFADNDPGGIEQARGNPPTHFFWSMMSLSALTKPRK